MATFTSVVTFPAPPPADAEGLALAAAERRAEGLGVRVTGVRESVIAGCEEIDVTYPMAGLCGIRVDSVVYTVSGSW